MGAASSIVDVDLLQAKSLAGDQWTVEMEAAFIAALSSQEGKTKLTMEEVKILYPLILHLSNISVINKMTSASMAGFSDPIASAPI